MEQGTKRRRNARKRRLAVAAIFALAVAVGAPLLAPGAGALVANPGEIDVTMNLTVSTPNFTVAGMSTSGLGAASMQKNGVIKIPKASLTFEPVVVPVNLPQPADASSSTDPSTSTSQAPTTATVQAVATSDFTGGLDPTNGAALIAGDFEEIWTQTGTMTGCIVGPFHVVAGTDTQGAVGYSTKTGSVSMVDPGYTLDAVPSGAAGCGGLEGSLNSALALPVTTTTTTTGPGSTTTTTFPANAEPPIPSIVVSLTFNPAPLAAVPAPVSHPRPPKKTPRPVVTQPTSFTPLPSTVSGQPPAQPNRPVRHRRVVVRTVHHHSRTRNDSKNSKTKKRKVVTKKVRSGTLHPARSGATHRKAPKRKPAATANGSQPLQYTNAAFIKRPQSAVATVLDLIGLIGLLGFSSLALWLVTTELSEFSASSKRLRTHRIAGITK